MMSGTSTSVVERLQLLDDRRVIPASNAMIPLASCVVVREVERARRRTQTNARELSIYLSIDGSRG